MRMEFLTRREDILLIFYGFIQFHKQEIYILKAD